MNEANLRNSAPRNNRANIKRRFNIDFPEICPFCHSDHFHIGVGRWYLFDEETMSNHEMVMANFECLDCERVFSAPPALNSHSEGAVLGINEAACLLGLNDKWRDKEEPLLSDKGF